MALLSNGYFQDGLKALLYLVPLLYIVVKKRELNLKYFWFFVIGFGLLFFGHFLDLLDEIEFLRRLFTSDSAHSLQDICEDLIGMTLGFLFLMIGLFLEFKNRKRVD